MIRKMRVLILFMCLIAIYSCRSRDKRSESPVPAAEIYLDYQLSAEDGDDKLTLKFRLMDEEDGDVLSLPAGAGLFLDGEELMPDSTKGSGVFFEVHKDMAAFDGLHTVSFRDKGTELLADSFSFHPIRPVNGIPDTIDRLDLQLDLEGLEKEDYIRTIATDTAFYNQGINRLDTVINGRYILRGTDLEKLHPGPVQLLLQREWEFYLEGENGPRGKKALNFMLKKEIYLR